MISMVVDRLGRRLSRALRPGPRAGVLLYHRVADEPSDPYGLCVPPDRFEEHLQIIREVGRPIALHELAASLRGGKVPDRAICVTFDDGYLDNLECAAPLLERHGVPATIFATTGPGGRTREFWWDELERVFLRPGRLPERLELEVGHGPRSWSLGEDADYPTQRFERHRHWHILDRETPTARHAVFRDAYAVIQPMRGSERSRTMDAVLAWAGLDAADVRRSHRAMHPEELVRVAASGVVRIGAHTVNHPALPVEPADWRQREVEDSRRQLEEWLGLPVEGFAYPYGMHDPPSVEAVRRAGYAFACSCVYRPVRRGIDPYVIPRIEVTPRDADRVEEVLRWQLA